MKLAIMQPYFLPYIGYWQLLNTVDRFVIYDDVNFIKGGWINRNRILINGKPSYITIPLYQASPNKRICDISLQTSPIWREKLIKSVINTYRKAPFFSEVFPVVENIMCYDTDNLSDFLAHHLRTMASFLGIDTELVITSRCYQNYKLTAQERILDICKLENATVYINPQGGQALYDTSTFQNADIELQFIEMQPTSYKQRCSGFVSNLSIVDVLMETGVTRVLHQLEDFNLIKKTREKR